MGEEKGMSILMTRIERERERERPMKQLIN
jgi:hypothetical protein